MAWKSIVYARQGKWLLGGTRQHSSHPFETREDAIKWAETVRDSQVDSVAYYELKEIACKNQIKGIVTAE